jgi:hypothetical protein
VERGSKAIGAAGVEGQEGEAMKYYTKCNTPLQKDARKVLRATVRAYEHARLCIDPQKLRNDQLRFEHAANVRIAERIIQAFNKAKTDAELVAAIELTVQLTQFVKDDPRAAPCH